MPIGASTAEQMVDIVIGTGIQCHVCKSISFDSERPCTKGKYDMEL